MVSASSCQHIPASIKETLKLPEHYEIIKTQTGKKRSLTTRSSDDDEDSVFSRLPDDTIPSRRATVFRGSPFLCFQGALKELYAINEAKIAGCHSPSESQKIYERAMVNRKGTPSSSKATLRSWSTHSPANDLDQEGKMMLGKYLGFKELMNRIEKDDDEYDEDGNLIVQESLLNAKELRAWECRCIVRECRQNMGTRHTANKTAMPRRQISFRTAARHSGPAWELQPRQPGSRISHGLPPLQLPCPPVGRRARIPRPLTGEWVSETPKRLNLKLRYPAQTQSQDKQDSSKIPSLKNIILVKEQKLPRNMHFLRRTLDRTDKERAVSAQAA